MALLDASVVRRLEPDADGRWQPVGGEGASALPALAEQMEGALLERALAERRSLLSTHPHLHGSLTGLARACAAARLICHLLVGSAQAEPPLVLAVHWVGRERPAYERRVAFAYYWETVAAAFALGEERRRIETELATLRRRAFWDALTGLPNKQALDDELARHARTWPFAVIALDFDGMREANERYGYEDGGDVLIRAVGRAIADLAGDGEFAARLHTAGDEFCLLLPGAAAVQAAARAEAVEAALDALHVPQTHRELYRGASLGYAVRSEGETPGQTLGRAIEAMRERKRARRR